MPHNYKVAIVGGILTLWFGAIVGVTAHFSHPTAQHPSPTSSPSASSDVSELEGEASASDLPAQEIAFTDQTSAFAHAYYGDTLLFFTSSDCQSCQAMESSLKNGGLSQLPLNLTIISVDLPTHSDLAKKYTVTSSDTWIQVNLVGDPLQKWSGNGLESLKSHLK